MSALGDISMFPVKCPMHYEHCKGTIDARIAKRILSEAQYSRFIEFSDRSVYGDGMRCIHCNNYVNFPSDMNHMARVECPYCTQCFCIRCKKTWHYGGRCPMDIVDESLEDWKHRSGAQKCPACKKLIEKDDPDTCNHMVHKITDGIPCVRERTDFCCKCIVILLPVLFVLSTQLLHIDLCGEEVTVNYPHEEAGNPGVNHFPEGVFQKCRTIIVREKQAEIDRLRRMKRLKNQNNLLTPSRKANNQIVPVMDEWEDTLTEPNTPGFDSPLMSPGSSSRNNGARGVINTPSTRLNATEAMWMTEPQRVQPNATRVLPSNPYDQFDQEWDNALAHVQATAGPATLTLNTPHYPFIGAPPSSPSRTTPLDSPVGSPSPSQRLLGNDTARSDRRMPAPLNMSPPQRLRHTTNFNRK